MRITQLTGIYLDFTFVKQKSTFELSTHTQQFICSSMPRHRQEEKLHPLYVAKFSLELVATTAQDIGKNKAQHQSHHHHQSPERQGDKVTGVAIRGCKCAVLAEVNAVVVFIDSRDQCTHYSSVE